MHMRRLELVESMPVSQEPSVRVAIATRDGKTVHGHFGSAQRFSVYDVSSAGVRFVETISFDDVSDESGNHAAQGDDRNGAKIAALDGVGVLVVQAIGGPVAARVIRAGMHPVKISEPQPIADVVAQLKALLLGDPPPWLRKVARGGQKRSMDFLDDDD